MDALRGCQMIRLLCLIGLTVLTMTEDIDRQRLFTRYLSSAPKGQGMKLDCNAKDKLHFVATPGRVTIRKNNFFTTNAVKFDVLNQLQTQVQVLDFLLTPDPVDTTKVFMMIGITWDGADKTESHVMTARCSRPGDEQLKNLMNKVDPSWEAKIMMDPEISTEFDFSLLKENGVIFDVRQAPFDDDKRAFVFHGVNPQEIGGTACELIPKGEDQSFTSRVKSRMMKSFSLGNAIGRRLSSNTAGKIGRGINKMMWGVCKFGVFMVSAAACTMAPYAIAGFGAAGVASWALGYTSIAIGAGTGATGSGIMGLVAVGVMKSMGH